MVDIVCNSDYYKKRIIFTNSKNSRNNEVYSKLLTDMQERFEVRGHEVRLTVEQVRNKLKKLIIECKKVALTVKTATGVNRLQEEKNYGPWFPMLFALVKVEIPVSLKEQLNQLMGAVKMLMKNQGQVQQVYRTALRVQVTDRQMVGSFLHQSKTEGKKRKEAASSCLNAWRSC